MMTTNSNRRPIRLAGRAWLRIAAVSALVTVGCATSPGGNTASRNVESARPDFVLSEAGKRALENVYLFVCAPDYLVHPEKGLGPARERLECLEKVAQDYTTIEAVRSISWNGSGYSLSEAERRGIVRYGADYLADYVRELLQRESGSDQIAQAD